MWGCMCQFKCRGSRGYIYNSSYYHHQIRSINLSHCCHILLGYVPEVIAPSYAVGFTHTHTYIDRYICIYIYIYIYIGRAGFYVFNYCAVVGCAQIEYIMARWSYTVICTLHYPIIIIMETYLGIELLIYIYIYIYILARVCD